MALHERGVDHKDVSIGNVLLGTDPSNRAGFIADLDRSISEEAIKSAYPAEHEASVLRALREDRPVLEFSLVVGFPLGRLLGRKQSCLLGPANKHKRRRCHWLRTVRSYLEPGPL